MNQSQKIPVPREHGAWGMLIMPFLMCVGVMGVLTLPMLLIFVSSLALFFTRYPLSLLIKTSLRGAPRDAVWWNRARWSLLYLGVSGAAVLPLILIWDRMLLLPVGLGSAVLLGMNIEQTVHGAFRSIRNELLGVVGLTLIAPVTTYAETGEVQTRGMVLWALNLLYFSGTIFYVKSRVEQFAESRSAMRTFWTGRVWNLTYHAGTIICTAVPAILGIVPPLTPVAFAPGFLKVCHAVFRRSTVRRLPAAFIRRIGIGEVVHSCLFTALVILAYRLTSH